jgi:hypothetical protein
MSNCYISTAVFTALGYDDNNIMLTSLRNFRDTYMSSTPELKAIVKEYYVTAPVIVASLQVRTDSRELFLNIYNDYLVKAVKAIELGKNEIALKIYTKMYLKLKNLAGV